jgi:hypothetical protein
MSVFFLYPAFLAGLAAACLPILIHLLNRRRLERIRFPAVRFILLSQKRISRSYRLRHWLLLALRTFAVVLLVLLLANPIWQTGAGLFAGGGPVSLVVLLDNSLSMTWSGDGSGFKQAKEAARLLLTALNEGDRAALLPTNAASKVPARLHGQKDVLLRELDAIEIADGTANLAGALERAYELLNEPAGSKEIRFITDGALTGWDRFSMASLKRIDPSVPIKLIRVGRKGRALNAAVKEVRLTSHGVGVGMPLQLEASVGNFSEQELKDALVQLSIDGKSKAQKLVTVAPRGEASVTFQTRIDKPGSHTGQINLKADGLAGNGTAHFVLDAQDSIKVLIIDGDPQTSLVQSESFFLGRALNPAGEPGASLFLPTIAVVDALNGMALDNYHAVILCNVASLTEAVGANLQDFVRKGGGLLIFSGDTMQPESYNQKLAPLMPAELREKKAGAEATAEKIGNIAANHPALAVFADPILLESLRSVRVWGYASAARGKASLISLANGEPFLLEQKLGAGKVMLITTSADRDWTDLPLKTAYLPLLQSLVEYAGGGRRGRMDGGILVDAPKELSLPAAFVGKAVRIVKPDKRETEVPVAPERDRAAATIAENDRAGIYRLTFSGIGGKDSGAPEMYAVNRPFLESRLEEIGEAELQAKLAPARAEILPIEALKEGGRRTDLALPLLALLIITLLLEGWLGQRF